ncbi:MAG: hypothetical protein WBQ86_24230 [Candidatus Binatus sp.]
MKNFLTIVSMALIMVTAAAVSAYCGNATIIVSSQAKPGPPETAIVPGGMLASEIGAQNSQGGAGTSLAGSADNTIGTPPLGTPGTGDPVPGCTNGMAVGNKHCVNTPSQ